MSDEIKIPEALVVEGRWMTAQRVARWMREETLRRVISMAEGMAMSEGGNWRAGLKALIKGLQETNL